MKKPVRFVWVLACGPVCLVAVQHAGAADRGFYVGGYYGQSSKSVERSFYELFNDDIQAFSFFVPTEEAESFDDSDTAFGLFAGYRFSRHFAIEGGYNNFGQVTYKSRSSGDFPRDSGTTDINIESETTGFTLAALGVLPLSRNWEVFGRAGALFADTTISIAINAQGTQFIPPLGNRVAAADSQGSIGFYAGLGIARRFFEIYDARLEWHRAFDAGDEARGGQGDLDAALLSITATF